MSKNMTVTKVKKTTNADGIEEESVALQEVQEVVDDAVNDKDSYIVDNAPQGPTEDEMEAKTAQDDPENPGNIPTEEERIRIEALKLATQMREEETKLAEEMKAELMQPANEPMPEDELPPAPEIAAEYKAVPQFDVDKTPDKNSENKAVRNVQNVGAHRGQSQPRFGGPYSGQGSPDSVATITKSKVNSKRTGVFVINEDKPVNENTTTVTMGNN